jgi:NAD(P)-dependent dehydrogenase (short-subunit alcohol dehydrogenase family)
MSNQQKVIVITGASQGMGAETVKAFRSRGHRVVATARSIKPTGDADLLAVAGDIGDPATARRVIDEAIERFGRIDTLVNNAGIFVAKPFTEYTAEDFKLLINVNLAGFFYVTQLALAQMEKQSSGHIVNITTTLVDHAMEALPAAMASLTKGGLAAVTRALAIEYAKRGIRVNAVAPGMIKTPMFTPDLYAKFGALHPMGRMGEMSDIVEAILYLDSAPFVTGEILHVDGGQIAGH